MLIHLSVHELLLAHSDGLVGFCIRFPNLNPYGAAFLEACTNASCHEILIVDAGFDDLCATKRLSASWLE